MPLWSSEPAVHYAEAVPGAGVVSVGVRAGLLSPNSPAYVRIVKRLYVLDILDSFFFLFLLPAYYNSEGIPSVFFCMCAAAAARLPAVITRRLVSSPSSPIIFCVRSFFFGGVEIG